MELTFLFADLAGFTAATEAHGDEAAVNLAVRLEKIATASLGPGDRLVKSIGDEVMCASPDPLAAVELAARLLEAAGVEADFPLLRCGAHNGPAQRRDDDYFGSAVNTAARVADAAAPGQFLGTRAVADAARSSGIDVVDLGSYPLRNITREIELFEIGVGPRRSGEAIDPVCQMAVSRVDAVELLRHDGVEYWFCSIDCSRLFTAEPDPYVRRSSASSRAHR